MKNCALLLILTLTTATMLSQDWAPFVAGKTYYYSQQQEDEIRIVDFEFTRDLINGNLMYYGTPFEMSCEMYIREQLIDDHWWYLDPDVPLFYTVESDFITIIGHHEGSIHGFRFHPNARPGDQWTTMGLTIFCTEETVMDIFGTPDSIRRYEFITPSFEVVQMILSKNHGFAQLPALSDVFNIPQDGNLSSYFELVGIIDSSGALGYQRPDFSEYFHLQPGDILVWKNYEKQYIPAFIERTRYHVDSLIAAYIESDSVYYMFHRRTFDIAGHLISESNDSRHFLRHQEGVMLAAPTNWFGKTTDPLFENGYFHTTSLYLTDNESQHPVTNFSFTPLLLWQEGCSVQLIPDIFEIQHFDTRHGLRGWYFSSIGGESWAYITGSVIDGEIYGDIELPTSVFDLTQRSVRIYPNPAQDILSVEGDLTSCSSIAIFDIYGREVMREPCFSSLSVARLHSGVYFMQFLSADRDILATTRFIRQ